MADTARLNTTFQRFASFGTGSNQQGPITIDNAHFAKLCRDTKLIDKNLTSVDVDLVFKKVLPKGERRLLFPQFQQALQLLSEIKYKNDSQGYQKLMALVVKGTPNSTGTVAEASGIYSKLTDASLYTGSHKLRFDADGKGRGLEGREPAALTHDLSQVVARNSGTTKSKRPVTVSMEKISSQQGTKSSKQNTTSASNSKLSASKSSLSKSGNVYDRLTDSAQYTGTHKHRFDSTGRGRGLSGRDAAATGSGTVSTYRGGNVNSLSQILRK